MSPAGETLDAAMSESLATTAESYCIICWHYEGIDARIFDFFPIQEVSIWDYVLSSGELAALVVIDSIVRLVPGVLSAESLSEESFSPGLDRQKEYPQYSRPEVYEWVSVPAILLSWDQKKIWEWKRSQLRK
jgi:tRNA (guanine37-N1)-methyltransferase